MHRLMPTARPWRLTLALGFLLVASARESRGQPMAFYYWKDIIGACPMACDNSRYGCPCRRDYCQIVNGELKCGF